MERRIYLASSWRNPYQPILVRLLREQGHRVYDFRNPSVGYDNPVDVTEGFAWSQLDHDWQQWDKRTYRDCLQSHPVAARGFQSDWQAMQWADTGVLLLPSGRSAHIEAGYFTGAGKDLHILLDGHEIEPELMYLMATAIHVTPDELFDALCLVAGRAG